MSWHSSGDECVKHGRSANDKLEEPAAARSGLHEPARSAAHRVAQDLRRQIQGRTARKRKGQSVEFADYKNYAIGDDLRFLDWNIYARLDRLFIKLFCEEEDLDVNVLIDCSTSMDCGEPNKFWYGRRLAAAMDYIALGNFDRVNLYGLSDSIKASVAGLRGRSQMHRILSFLQDLRRWGAATWARRAGGSRSSIAARASSSSSAISTTRAATKSRCGTCWPAGRTSTPCRSSRRGKLQPELAGDLKLIDVEDGDAAEVTVTSALLASYKKTLGNFCQSLHDYCTARGITYLLTGTDVPAERLILNYLRARGLVR